MLYYYHVKCHGIIIVRKIENVNSLAIFFQYGLYSSFMGCFIYCLLGTSKDITLGPTAIMSLMTAAFGTSPIEHDATVAIVLTLFCGIVQFLMGVLHLGKLKHNSYHISLWATLYIWVLPYCARSSNTCTWLLALSFVMEVSHLGKCIKHPWTLSRGSCAQNVTVQHMLLFVLQVVWWILYLILLSVDLLLQLLSLLLVDKLR